MTELLQQAFAEAAKLPVPEQEVLASRLLAELAAEDDFDRAIARKSDKLAALACEALAEHRSGQTEALDPQMLSFAVRLS
jgi:transposase